MKVSDYGKFGACAWVQAPPFFDLLVVVRFRISVEALRRRSQRFQQEFEFSSCTAERENGVRNLFRYDNKVESALSVNFSLRLLNISFFAQEHPSPKKNQSKPHVTPIIEGRAFLKHPKQEYRNSSIETMITIATNNLTRAIHSPRLRQRHKYPRNSPELPLFLIFSQVFARFEHFSQQNPSFSPHFQFRISCFNPTIMQNKPNLLHTQMNVTTVLTTAYQNIRPSRRLKNKPNFNPTTPEPPRRLCSRPIWRKPESHTSMMVVRCSIFTPCGIRS